MMAKLKKLKAFSPDEFARALYQEAQIEATECKKNTPVLTGNLRATIHVEGPERQGRRIWCTIVAGEGGTGGKVAEYALYVSGIQLFQKILKDSCGLQDVFSLPLIVEVTVPEPICLVPGLAEEDADTQKDNHRFPLPKPSKPPSTA